MRRILTALLAACGSLPGCESGGGAPGTPDAGWEEARCSPGASFDISGTAGVLAVLNVHVNASGLVETDTTAELMLLLDVTQAGADVAVVADMCDIRIPDVPIAGQERPVHFEPGPGLIESVPDVSGSGRLDGDRTCATFTSDPITIVIGARMDPPTAGTLPEANAMGEFARCPPAGASCELAIGASCACDQEGDGKPGATLLAMNVPAVPLDEVYVDLRTTFSLAGEVWSSDLIVGEVAATLEQGILACHKANGSACNAQEVGAVKQINPDIEQSDGEPSVFRAVRVGADMTCAELLEGRDQVFPR